MRIYIEFSVSKIENFIEEYWFCSFREALVKLFYQLQNRCQQRRQKSLELSYYPNRGNGRRFQQ